MVKAIKQRSACTFIQTPLKNEVSKLIIDRITCLAGDPETDCSVVEDKPKRNLLRKGFVYKKRSLS